MLRIAGEVIGGGSEGLKVEVHSVEDARMVQREMANRCIFTAACGCGKFHLRGRDGVSIFKQAERHAHETGHRCFGHFMFEKIGGAK